MPYSHSDSLVEDFDHEAALKACSLGDQDALRMLYVKECAGLLGVAQRIVRDRSLAEDVVHDAFVKIWTRAGSFDPLRGSARGWMYTVVRHDALNRLRAADREAALDDDLAQAAEMDQATYAHVLAMNELEARLGSSHLYRCLRELDASKRASIVYAYVDGCSHREIAERLNAPLGTVKAWIQRGLTSLRACMR